MQDEKNWQAKDDAQTLIRAAEIKMDKKRLKAALKELKQESKNSTKAMEDAQE